MEKCNFMIVTQVLQSPYASPAELVELIPPHSLTDIILINDRKKKKKVIFPRSLLFPFGLLLSCDLKLKYLSNSRQVICEIQAERIYAGFSENLIQV